MLYGRDPERAVIGALLDAARESRSGALVLRGEPGIGKTALLADARERAADMQVLTARGVESESELPFAALHQLVGPALGDLDGVPAPQATALASALGLADGEPPERFLVFAACLSLLARLAERRPVLCLVDDAHWLDAPSADAFRFVARRLGAEGIAVVFAAREGDVRRFDASDIASLALAGLDAEAAALLARSAGVAAAPPVLGRLVERTRGNALALLELPSVLSEAQLSGDEPLPDALPLTREIERTFLERVRRLPAGSQSLLLVAAADDTERIASVAAAAGRLGAGPDALNGAEEAGLVAVRGHRLAFRHPLVRSAVYAGATSTERRAAHRALADALADAPEHADHRAWHLAASAIDPDDEAVKALEGAAARASERGGHAAAARGLERAAELSADPQARGRRLAAAAVASGRAGEDDRADALAARARPLVADARLRADLAHVTGLAQIRRGRPLDAHPMLLDAARGLAREDPGGSVELLLLALGAAQNAGSVSAMREACAVAEDVVPAPGDDTSRFALCLLLGRGAMAAGDAGRGAPLLEQAVAWASTADDARQIHWGASAAFALGDDRRLSTLLDRAMALARERGEIGILAQALASRSTQLFFAQRLDEAALAAAEAVAFHRELGAVNLVAPPLAVLAGVAAVRGREDEAVAAAGEALEIALAHGLAERATAARWMLGLLDLGLGRWAEALERLAAVSDLEGDAVLTMLILPDTIEAALRAGRRDEARRLLPAYERWAAPSGAPWAQARLASCRAMAGEGEEATSQYERAVRMPAGARPFDLARIRLLYGEHLRRERRRVDARAQLRGALEGFERLSAAPWAERARAELRASGETARRREPGVASALTPQELQVARFVAQGLSNKEVAAQLYLSPRTIDSHLRNAFAKLGVTSRTQLARLPLGDGDR